MKILYLFLIAVFVPGCGSAQGRIDAALVKYKQTNYFEFENMPADMPKSQAAYMRLLFDKTSSIYEKDPDAKEEQVADEGMQRMFRRMRERQNRIYYKSLDNGTVLEQTSLFGKDFLISDSIAAIKWKVNAAEQKEILGYTCMKASFKDSTTNLVVFFTPQIPLRFGPDKYGNLPGLILEVQSAQLHIIATEVVPGAVAFQKPSKGTEVTRKEYEKIREEKMKEQREMWGGRGRDVRVIRQ